VYGECVLPMREMCEEGYGDGSWAVGRKGVEKGVVCAMESKGGMSL
jgi:hypothetical protein